MKTSNAIKMLIKARNKRYSDCLQLKMEESIDWEGKKLFTVTGYNAAHYFSSMSVFLYPMVFTHFDIIDNRTVEFNLNED